MPNFKRLLAATIFCAVAMAPLCAQDEVELSDGTKLEGRVVFEDAQELVLLVSASRERTLEQTKVKSVRSQTRSLQEALDRWDQLKPGDIAGLWELAAFCRERGLSG